MKVNTTGLGAGAGALVVIALMVLAAFTPWVMFWCIGVLFGVTIPLTFKTWVAAMVFLALVRGGGD